MRKLVLSIVAVAMLATSALFAQETERSIGMYLDADSGYIAGNRNWDKEDGGTQLWEGYNFEVGISYAQNFAGNGLDWLAASLTLYGTMDAANSVYDEDGYTGTRKNALGTFGDWTAELGLTANGSVFGLDALDLSVSVDTDVLVSFGVGYGMEVGPGALSFGLGVDFYAYPYSTQFVVYDEDEANKLVYKDRMFDAVYLTVGYGLEFAEIWGFESVLEFGYNYVGHTGRIYELENDKHVLSGVYNHNLYLQWDNNLSVSLDGGFSAWAGLRLNVSDMIAFNNGYEEDSKDSSKEVLTSLEAGVDLALRAGVSYDFNF